MTPDEPGDGGPVAPDGPRQEFLWQLWFQQLQQLAWLAAAGAGAALIFLDKVGAGKPRRRALMAFICFALSAGISVVAQSQVASGLWERRDLTRLRKIAPGLAYFLLGAGAAALFLLVTS